MIRNLKALGLAVVAVFAMSAVAASAASAQVAEWGAGATTFKATQDPSAPSQLFKITGGLASFTCNEIHASGNLKPTVEGGTTATTLKTGAVTYSHAGLTENKCTGPLETEPKIEFKSCSYEFHAETTVSADEVKASVDINCTGTDEITANGGGLCTAHVPPQAGLKHVLFKTETPLTNPETVTGEATVTGISYKHTGLCGNGSGTNGTYDGKFTVTAFDVNNAQKDITAT